MTLKFYKVILFVFVLNFYLSSIQLFSQETIVEPSKIENNNSKPTPKEILDNKKSTPKPKKKNIDPRTIWQEQVVFKEVGKYNDVRPSNYHYQLSWNNILTAGVANMNLSFDKEGNIVSKVNGQTSSLARLFWKFDFIFDSLIDKSTLKPKSVNWKLKERKEEMTINNNFANDKVKCKIIVSKLGKKSYSNQDNPSIKNKFFRFHNTHDISSAVLYLRSLEYKIGDEVFIVIWPQDNAYFIKLKFIKREKRKYNFGKIPTLCFEVGIKKIRGKKLKLKNYRKAKKGKIWLSDDNYRMPVEIRSEVFIGDIVCKMSQRKFEDINEQDNNLKTVSNN